MSKPIKIVITQEDIDSADEYSDIFNCLLATSLKHRGFKDVMVGSFAVYVRRWFIFRKTYKVADEDNSAIVAAYRSKNLQSLLGKEITLT